MRYFKSQMRNRSVTIPIIRCKANVNALPQTSPSFYAVVCSEKKIRKETQSQVNIWRFESKYVRYSSEKQQEYSPVTQMSSLYSNQDGDELICKDLANRFFNLTMTMNLIIEQDSSNFSLYFF